MCCSKISTNNYGRSLNVNVPDGATINNDIKITKQARNNYSTFKKTERRDLSMSYVLKPQLDANINNVDRKSDAYAFYFDKVISIIPLTWDLSVDTDLNS